MKVARWLAVAVALVGATSGLVFASDAQPLRRGIRSLPHLSIASAADRAEGTEPQAPTERLERVGTRFGDSQLLSRIFRNVERSGGIVELRYLADRSFAGAAFEVETSMASQRLSRTGQGAVRSALLDWAEEQTELDEVLESDFRSVAENENGVRYDLGVSNFLPRLGMRLPTLVPMRLSLGADGHAGVDLAPGVAGRTLLHAGYDTRSHTADLRCLFRF